MKTPLRVLIVEDSEFDAVLLVNLLRKGGYAVEYRRVDLRESLTAALAEKQWDLVLADYNLPKFSMFEALQILQQSGLDLPFIIVSGGIGEDVAVAAMKAGAHDYLMKGNLARLVPAVNRELWQAASRAARRQAEAALRESELRYRLLWETSTDAVIFIDSNAVIRFANPAVVTVFGYRPEEIIGQNMSLLDGATTSVANAAPTGGPALSVQAKLKSWADRAAGRHQDGRHLFLDVAFSELVWQGANWLVAFIRDLTERKKAEKALREHKEQFRVAREIQQQLFPKNAPDFPGLDLAGASFPAEATGGDYFDYLTLMDGGLGIVVGDVSGHGVGPAMLMAETRAYLRILARNRQDVGQILTRANRILAEDVSCERFVTLMLAKVELHTNSLVYASAGHPSGYLLGPGGEVKYRLKRTGIPLGLQPATEYSSTVATVLVPGDIIVLITDGVEETMAPNDEFFGAERALAVMRAHLHCPAREMVAALYQAVRDFAQDNPPLDDVTVVVAKVL